MKFGAVYFSVFRPVARFLRNKGANVAVMCALMAPAMVGGVGIGLETGNWYLQKRDMQNAADEAAVAAATNDSSSYSTEALATTANYGYTNGSNSVVVSASNTATCPSGGNTCYSVTIKKWVPIYLAAVVGYKGNGHGKQLIEASAIALETTTPRSYCILALGTIGTALQSNGAPKANLNGCNTMSDSNADCNGHDLNAGYGDAAGTDTGCGLVQQSNVPAVPDPYAYLASNIPTNPCSSYPQEPTTKSGTALPSSNLLSGTVNWSGNVVMCGDVQLTGNVTVNAPNGATLVIENGQLDTNSKGYTLQTASGSSLTVVFTGTNNSTNYTHAPTGGGTLNFNAPTSGAWSGVAIYQDPAITNGVNIAAAGNSPTWDLSGLVYLPNSTVVFSGAVNKSSYGASCFALVVDDITINGTADIISEGGCAAAGLNLPVSNVPSRGQLVE